MYFHCNSFWTYFTLRFLIFIYGITRITSFYIPNHNVCTNIKVNIHSNSFNFCKPKANFQLNWDVSTQKSLKDLFVFKMDKIWWLNLHEYGKFINKKYVWVNWGYVDHNLSFENNLLINQRMSTPINHILNTRKQNLLLIFCWIYCNKNVLGRRMNCKYT